MDTSIFSSIHWPRRSLSSGRKKISTALKNLYREKSISEKDRRLLLGFTFLALSLFLGQSASQLAGERALESWKRTNKPKLSLWQYALEKNAFEELKDLKIKHKIVRSLPTYTEENGEVWRSENTLWIAIFTEENDLPDLSIFGSKVLNLNEPTQADFPRNWIPAGNGWEAFKEVLSDIENRPKLDRPVHTRKATRKYQDPREIQY